jgi:hypothetical protein
VVVEEREEGESSIESALEEREVVEEEGERIDLGGCR